MAEGASSLGRKWESLVDLGDSERAWSVNRINTIVRQIGRQAPLVVDLVKEAERQAEIRRREWAEWEAKRQREEEARRVEKALAYSREDLLKIISGWAEANRIESFFREIEARASGLDVGTAQALAERVQYARAMVGSVDALDHFLGWKPPAER